MSTPPIILKTLKDKLQILQDKTVQIRIWTGADEHPLSYVETICSLFDDSGLSTALEQGEAAAFLGAELTNSLIQIGSLLDCVDYSKDPVQIANLPEMEEIRHLAQQALNDPVFNTDDPADARLQLDQRRT